MHEALNNPYLRQLTRRNLLGRTAMGIGSLALTALLNPRAFAEPMAPIPTGRAALPKRWTGVVHPLHYKPRIKRVIQLCMAGGPSHLETFDYKPTLGQLDGKAMPESITKGQPIAQLQGNAHLRCMGPQYPFERFGKSGQQISVLLPHIGAVSDEICIIRSMTTDAINHDPAHTFMNTGSTISGRPAMGSWVWYGLGSESEGLPGFIVLTSTGKSGQQQPIASRQWSAGFLPSRFQGVRFYSQGDAVHYIRDPDGVTRQRQRDVIDAVSELNRIHNEAVDDPEIATRISQYELAFKMQVSVPELMDLSREPQHILEMYGTKGADGSFAANCLTARRLAERGVRFIQLYHRDWDHHGNLKNDIKIVADEVDRATAALILDLKQRGMLDETLIIWGGEFGRTPMAQGNGRDHHIKGFSMFLAGGGIKGGLTWGSTDEFGYNAVENVVPVHDLHATVLRLMGVDHKRLTYRFQGRDYRLTDVFGNVVDGILA